MILIFKTLIFNYMHTCVSVYGYMCLSTGAKRRPEEDNRSPLAAVRCQMWCWTQSSGRAVCVLLTAELSLQAQHRESFIYRHLSDCFWLAGVNTTV